MISTLLGDDGARAPWKKRVEEREAVGVGPEIGDGVAIDVRHATRRRPMRPGGIGHAEGFLAGGREALRPGAFRGDETVHGVVVQGGVEEGAGVVDEAEIGRRDAKRVRRPLGDGIILREAVQVRRRRVDAVRAGIRAEVVIERAIFLVDHEHVLDAIAQKALQGGRGVGVAATSDRSLRLRTAARMPGYRRFFMPPYGESGES